MTPAHKIASNLMSHFAMFNPSQTTSTRIRLHVGDGDMPPHKGQSRTFVRVRNSEVGYEKNVFGDHYSQKSTVTIHVVSDHVDRILGESIAHLITRHLSTTQVVGLKNIKTNAGALHLGRDHDDFNQWVIRVSCEDCQDVQEIFYGHYAAYPSLPLSSVYLSNALPFLLPSTSADTMYVSYRSTFLDGLIPRAFVNNDGTNLELITQTVQSYNNEDYDMISISGHSVGDLIWIV